MSLTIETGEIVSGADSYATVAELRAFALKRGVTVPAGDEACEVLLIKACDYIQAQSQRYKGAVVQWDHPLAWPRYGVCVNGYELPSDEIPPDIKNAQMQLAIDAQTIDLLPTINAASQKGPVIEQTVDVITTKWAAPAVNRATSLFAKANGYLAKFFQYGPGQVPVVRV